MSTVETRLPLAEAEVLAREVVALLRPACERIAVAGSIRRRKADVGDLEIVCVPRTDEVRSGLFGDVVATENRLDGLCDRLVHERTFGLRLDKNGRTALGSRYKRLTYKGTALDLFACLPPAQLPLLMVIRTGPAEFSKRLVTPRREGGWLPDYLRVRDGQLVHRRDGEVVPLETEADVFNILGRPYVPPEERR